MDAIEGFSPANFQYDVRDQLRGHVYERSMSAFREGDAARDRITEPAHLLERQQFICETFVRSLGGLPKGGSLNAQTVGRVDGDGFHIEKVIFESRPKHFVTANLYLPEGVRSATGAVLFLCGHHEQAKHAAEYQAVCQTLVAEGLVVLAQDPIGQGERFSYHESDTGKQTVPFGPCEHEYAGMQCIPLGQTLGRYFLHDAMRGVDYLITRPEVDPQRIGVTGNSGGGTQTSMMMMADPRIAAAAPATFIMNRETYLWTGGAQDAEQIWPGLTSAGLDHEDILLAMCPKPVRVLAARWDFFPIEGTRRTVDRCRRLWKLCGQSDKLDLVEDDCLHQYSPALARSAAEFFRNHLLDSPGSASGVKFSPLEASVLRCTKSGQVRGEIPGAQFAHQACLDELELVTRDRKVAAGSEWLRGRVLANRSPCDLNPRFLLESDVFCGVLIDRAWWWSQRGIINQGMVLRAHADRGKKLPVTLAVWDGGCTRLRPHGHWIRAEVAKGRAIFLMEPTGTGSIAARPLSAVPSQEFFGVIHKLCDDLFWLGDSLAALRVWDVIRALDLVRLWPGLDANDLFGYAHGRHGLYLQLAALLDRRIKRLEVYEGIGSFEKVVRTRDYDSYDIKALLIPNVLRHFDLQNPTSERTT
ncbi:MAG TPA: prolyl oligopeptidase family serine peptidase [Terrimicrobiaceae bacterium]|nr:prolyl oligopeptidase family serine peptidase [Terrimicrobiaceae bacterium]